MQAPPVALRLARPDDFDAIYAALTIAHAEIKPFAVEPMKAQAFIRDVMHRGVVLVTEQDGRIVGTCAMLATSPWWSEEMLIEGVWIYVLPEYRRTPHASTMLRGMRRYAERVGMPMQVSFMARQGHEQKFNAKRRLFERTLGHPTGMTFFVPRGG